MRFVVGVLCLVSILGCGDDGVQAPVDRRCEKCTAEQACLQSFDGTCQSMVFCVAPGTVCGGVSIPDGPPCGTEIAGAIVCYGP